MKRPRLLLAASACIAALLPAVAEGDTLQGLGDLPGGATNSYPYAVSGDGAVVVGNSDSTSGVQAFRWTLGGGIVGLGAGGGSASYAYGVSADGAVVVGERYLGGWQAFRWTQGGGMVPLGDLPGGLNYSAALGASSNGAVVVGTSNSASGFEAFRWTQGGGMVGLGDVPGGSFASYGNGVSADGSVVVGRSQSASGYEAFRWTQGGGMVGLGDLAGGSFESNAQGVSADGAVVAGGSYSSSGLEAFRWTQGGGMVGLGDLPGGGFESFAYATNADGAVVVGYGTAASSREAVAWTAAYGMRSVASVLSANGVDLTGWSLVEARGVSADGRVIVGTGQHSGTDEAWIANIDLGLISIDDLSVSLSSVVGANQSAQQTGAAHIESLLNLASHYGAPAAPNGWSAWGGVSLQHYDVLRIDPEAVAGRLGVAFQPSPAWRVGFGVQWGEREDDLNVFSSESESEQWGAGLFASYAPRDTGVRVHAALAANRIQNQITRGYLNGATPVTSSGAQDGVAFGAGVQVGWAFALGDATRLTPFASYETSRIDLDAYAETGGPFPATFNAVEDTLEITRFGVEAEHRYSETLRSWASLAYAHRLSDALPGISGSVAALSSPFAIAGASVDDNWGELELGAEWRAPPAMRIQASVNVADSGDTDANYGGRLTLVYDF